MWNLWSIFFFSWTIPAFSLESFNCLNNIEHFVHKHLCCPPFLLTDHISYQPSFVRSCLIKYLQNRIFVGYWGIYSGKIGYIQKNKPVEQRRLQLKKILRKNSINRDYERGEELKQWAIFGNTWKLVTKNMAGGIAGNMLWDISVISFIICDVYGHVRKNLLHL